jgi:hypothetical protein
LGRVRLPGPLDAAGDRIAALAAAEAALPAEALLLDGGTLRLRTDKRRIAGTMTLAEGVPAGDQRDGLRVCSFSCVNGINDS